MPPASEPERRPKRPVACDRCRTHKLRCERSTCAFTMRPAASSTLETCVRCARAGTACTTSPPQRVGRPPRRLDGWMSAMDVDHGPTTVPSPPEVFPDSMLADLLSGWSEPEMHKVDMDGFEDLYTGKTGPSSPSAGSLCHSIASPLAEAESFAYMDHYSTDAEESQAKSTGLCTLLDQQMMHWQTREELQSEDGLDDLFLAFSDATGRSHMDWPGGTQSATSTASAIPATSAKEEPKSFPTIIQPYAIMTQRCSISEASSKSSSQEQSVRDLSVLISSLSQSLEDVQGGRAPAFGVALRCADEFLEVVDDLAGPVLTQRDSVVDKGDNRTLDASQALLLLNCYIKIVAIFRAAYSFYGVNVDASGSLYSPSTISRSPPSERSRAGSVQMIATEIESLSSSPWSVPLPFRNRGLQLSTIIHMTLHVLSRAEEVLKSGTQNTAVGPLVQATMRLEDLEGNISALLQDMRAVGKVLGIA
ncbi:RNA polymerase II-specific transcription factor-like protein [Microdochium nivale]|nr:RNA polymerase II-specific transcription factor-like protein [Microdochium nivale]